MREYIFPGEVRAAWLLPLLFYGVSLGVKVVRGVKVVKVKCLAAVYDVVKALFKDF